MTYWYRPDEMSLRLLYFCKLHSNHAREESSLTRDIKIFVETCQVSSVVFLPMHLTLYLGQQGFLDGNGSPLLYPLLSVNYY